MGKKTLTKSTSKKKKKAAAKKKMAAKSTPKKKAPAKKAAEAKSKPTAKAAPKTPKKTAPKKTAPKAKPVSVKDLLKKKFDIVIPDDLYTVPKDKVTPSVFSAPEFFEGFAEANVKRIKGLLANTYSEKDLQAAAEKAAAEKAAAEKAAAEKAAAEKAAAEKAAAEKAAAEKAAAEKAAAEKAAAEKAAAEKAAAEKAAAEKAAAEKAAAEKAAAEKAAAEKAAAEKAAAEKAAAEKAAAEKAAAEKAAAEKAAAEKAAAEKAAAEKAAAEKAAAEKAAAQKFEVKVSYGQSKPAPAAKKPADPVDNAIKLMAAGVALLILMVIGGSTSNSFKYYLVEQQGALQIWKGKFAPLGKKMFIELPGVPAPEVLKETYSAGEVYPIVFQYYIDKADALLDVPGIPDFEGIKSALQMALEYGSTNALKMIANERLYNIDRLIFTYKADVAASRGSIDDLNTAIGFLGKVARLTSDEGQKALIIQKIADHEATILELENAETEAERLAEEAAVAECAAPEAEAGEAEGVAEKAPAKTKTGAQAGAEEH